MVSKGRTEFFNSSHLSALQLGERLSKGKEGLSAVGEVLSAVGGKLWLRGYDVDRSLSSSSYQCPFTLSYFISAIRTVRQVPESIRDKICHR